MRSRSQNFECRSIFERKTIYLDASRGNAQVPANSDVGAKPGSLESKLQDATFDEDYTVLVINSSQEMAKEITLQLTLSIPGCSIMFAPTIEVAKWILKRRRVSLVVSSPLLADGSIERLKGTLEKMDQPADLVVIGGLDARRAETLTDSVYRCKALRRIQPPNGIDDTKTVQQQELQQSIKSLGANIRNDLNNPLQEIVAMVFVARAGVQVNEPSDHALAAIEKAAKNMSKVVNGLEDKIRGVVASA